MCIRDRDILVDGGMGPATIKAMNGVELDRIKAYRIKYYADLVSDKPEQERFFFGWVKRVLEIT